MELHWSLSVRKRGDPRKIPHSAGENTEFRDDAVKRAQPTPVPIHTVILSEVSASLREADTQGWADGTSAHEIIAAPCAPGRVRAPAPTWPVLIETECSSQ